MIVGIRLVRGVPVIAASRRVTLARMSTKKSAKKSAAKKSAGVHKACGAELVKGATFCWHCKAPFDKPKKSGKSAPKKNAKK